MNTSNKATGGQEEASTTPFFVTRGVVLLLSDLQTLDWPQRAKQAGLTTIGTHISPHEVARFLQTDAGQSFLERCRDIGIQVEHELHAMSDLLPRDLFETDPSLFPADESGRRVRDYNLCVHSDAALEIVCQNAVRYTSLLPSTTGRYFYWPDDGQPMCRCPKCRELSDSDQALLVENHILQAIRSVDPRASLAHLAYATTLACPTQVKPLDGIFLEFAPISRLYDQPFRKQDVRMGRDPNHADLLDYLDANLRIFPRETAQILEYWLDNSRFSGWKREEVQALAWHEWIFLDDIRTYAALGIHHITTFAAWLDGDYVRRFGEPPVNAYGKGLLGYAQRLTLNGKKSRD